MEYNDEVQAQAVVDTLMAEGIPAKVKKHGKFYRVEIANKKSKKRIMPFIGGAIRDNLDSFGKIHEQNEEMESSHRPKIAQMPAGKRGTGITNKIDTDRMITPGLRGQTLSGRQPGRGSKSSDRKLDFTRPG